MRVDDYFFATSDDSNVFATNTLAIAKDYFDRGWAVTPVAYQTKVPILKGWQHTRLTSDAIHSTFGSGATNIGVVLGDLSNGLVDVDIDDTQAIYFADHFLPATGCVFGRHSNRRSHRLYQVVSPGRHIGFDVAGKPILEPRQWSSDGLSWLRPCLRRVH